MGRGRAKAKQVKVARQLKYSGGGIDLDRLRAEIGSDQVGGEHAADSDRYPVDDEDDEDDEDDDYLAGDGQGEERDRAVG